MKKKAHENNFRELEILVHSSFVYPVVTLGVMRVYFRNVQLLLIFLKNNEPNSPHEMSLNQPTITFSKLTMEALEQGVKCFQN